LLGDRCCDITVPNKHGPPQDKSGDTQDRFYEQLEQLFDNCPKYNMKILFGELMQNWGEKIFKPSIGNDSLHEDSRYNGVRVLNVVTF
jgi:hypothetical protein